MYINKPSAAKTEATDRVNLLDIVLSTGLNSGNHEKLAKCLLSLPRYPPFHDSHQKNSCFQTYKLNI